MKKEIRTIYSEKDDTTFIMEDTFEGNFLRSIECIGWYCGEPNDVDTRECSDRNMKATFDPPNEYVQQLKEFKEMFDPLPAIDPDDPVDGHIYDEKITIEFLGKRATFYFEAIAYNAISSMLQELIGEQE